MWGGDPATIRGFSSTPNHYQDASGLDRLSWTLYVYSATASYIDFVHGAHSLFSCGARSMTVGQVVSCLLHRSLVAFRVFTSPQPLVDIRPLLAIRTQLPGDDKSHREVHHDICSCGMVADKKLAGSKRKLALQPRHVVLDVDRHSLLGCLEEILGCIFHVPPRVQDSQAVKSECCFSGMDPL